MTAAFVDLIHKAPRPFDRAQADDIRSLFDDVPEPAADLLFGAAGCSGYLNWLMRQESDWLRSAFAMAPEDALGQAIDAMQDVDTGPIGGRLRRAKRRVALLTGLADLGGVWDLESVTGALTDLADTATHLALVDSISREIDRGKLPGCAPEDASDAAGIFVSAMGNMGARELNYSSDIDLILLFDETRYDPDEIGELRRGFIRATQRMVKLVSEVTSEGYVFRTDLRLRPDPSVTPVCIASDAAESYYETLGRTWERAAFIKARPCAGAIEAGWSFLERLRPFVWRRHLDFAAIQDAHDMRLRIRKHKGLTGPIQAMGHDLKLGQGGIREIEFFTQTRQLIVGGRDADLRQRQTRPALEMLAKKGWVKHDTAAALDAAYVEHRTLEHRLQMLEDAQTQTMPTSPETMARLADFCGANSVDEFTDDLTTRLRRVHQLTEPFFSDDGDKEAPPLDEIFADANAAEQRIGAWNCLPALRTQRARGIFRKLAPELLRRLQAAADPDAALRSLDAFLSRLPAGVQLFSLIQANPHLMDLLIDICGTAPQLARYLGDNAQVFDVVITPDFYRPLREESELTKDLTKVLAQADGYEAVLSAARIWKNERHFRIGVHLLRGLATPEEAAAAYSAVAGATLNALWPQVVAEFGKRHGPPPGAGAAYLAMGKLGSREMTVTSDLDLIVIYDAEGAEASEGRRPLSVSVYYARLTQAMIAALTSPMREGLLYRVDMRLRPSGRQGPVATSLASFRRYQAEDAWTWEHLALTRSRVVAGPKELADKVTIAIDEVLQRPYEANKVLKDARDMRRRLSEAHEAADAMPWEVKTGSGRMMDIELLAQCGALIHNLSGLRRPRRMLAALADLNWLDADQASELIEAHARLAALQQIGRLASEQTIDPQEGGEGLTRLALSVTSEANIDALRDRLTQSAARAAEIIDNRLAHT